MLKKRVCHFFFTQLSFFEERCYNLELESKKKNIGKFDDAGIDKNLIF